jgi:anti-anti-sigma factor
MVVGGCGAGRNVDVMDERNAGLAPVAGSPARPDEAERLRGLVAPLQVVDHDGGRVGLRVAGEVDLNSHQVWEQALHRVLGRSGDVHLDLTGLRFIDARSTVALVRVAGMLADGQRLVLHHPPPSLQRVLETLWPAGVPAILIQEDAT